MEVSPYPDKTEPNGRLSQAAQNTELNENLLGSATARNTLAVLSKIYSLVTTNA
jgi:hypothetical protein